MKRSPIKMAGAFRFVKLYFIFSSTDTKNIMVDHCKVQASSIVMMFGSFCIESFWIRPSFDSTF